jgi:phosphatidylglycerol---prolipoprotein diacylglyceryl transferase
MLPRLFHIGSYTQATYGVLVALAFLVAISVTSRLARRAGLNSDAVVNLGIVCGLSAIVGAKIMMYLVDIREYIDHPGEIFSVASLQAGGVFYGGLIAALIAAVIYMRRHHLPALRTADVFAPGIALGHGIGRLGCFAAGCCYGLPTKLPWGVRFTNPLSQVSPELLGIPLHPTQLYESAAEFLIFGILYWRVRRQHPPGAIICLYLILYSTVRFLVEFVRDHPGEPNPFGGPLNTSQWISLALGALGAAYFLRKLGRVSAPAAPLLRVPPKGR